MEALLLLTEKRNKTVKGRMVYNGKPSREWIGKEDSASLTATLESILITAVIDAKERRDVMMADVPNAFIQTVMPKPKDGQARVMMKITGVLVDMLVQLDPALYGLYIIFENNRKVLYIQVLHAIYGMLESSLLWYKKFRKDLEKHGFKFNPYNPCIANCTVAGKQHTIRFHVDDLMSSHEDPRVNDKFLHWLNKMYGGYGEVKAMRGRTHDYLRMLMMFRKDGKLNVDMSDYVQSMVDDFSKKLKSTDTTMTPAGENLFDVGDDEPLDKARMEEFHTTVAKGLFVSKQARPDIQPTIVGLCTRVTKPNETDWRKLIHLIKYLNGTRRKILTLSADTLNVIKWHVDASFAVHPDFKSHTGAVMTFGEGAVQSMSRKQKINTSSSTHTELVAADDAVVMILWTKMFLEAQGYPVK